MPLFCLPQPTALPGYSSLGQLPIYCPKNKLGGRRAFLEQEKSKHRCVRKVVGVEHVKKAMFALRKSKKLQQSYAGSPPLLGTGLSSSTSPPRPHCTTGWLHQLPAPHCSASDRVRLDADTS